jgi:hypothetical protein
MNDIIVTAVDLTPIGGLDATTGYFKLNFSNLDPNRQIASIDIQVNPYEARDVITDNPLPKGTTEWTSDFIKSYRRFENDLIEEAEPFLTNLLYVIICNISYTDGALEVWSANVYIENDILNDLPYVTNFVFLQTGDDTADISATLNTVYTYAGITETKGTLFELFLEDTSGTTLLAKGYLHEAIQNGGVFDGYNNLIFYFDNIGYDGGSVDIKFSVLATNGDKYTIRITNKYTSIPDRGPSTASIVLYIISDETPNLRFQFIANDSYSYDGSRVTGVVKDNIVISAYDWNNFISVLENYFNYSELGINWNDIKSQAGESLTANRWNAVIKTLKRYYDTKGVILDNRIQEVVKGQKITPEMFILVNEAFKL